MSRTKEEPFGQDHDCLIICRDEMHRRRVIDAFKTPARYMLNGQALMGLRFSKIIVFEPDRGKTVDRDYLQWEKWIREVVCTKLAIGCRDNLFIV